MKLHRTIGLAAVAGLALSAMPAGASADDDQPEYTIDWDQVADEIGDVEEATAKLVADGVIDEAPPVLSGEIEGAAWIGQVPDPDAWNGDLVIYAHGYRGEGLDLTVDAAPEFEFLLEQGIAWAASSYRRNSYDPGIGVIDTKNLTTHFQNMLGKDLEETYLIGISMGGHVTAAAIEKYPKLWDGALPACGVVGDVELFDYFLDYNLGAAAIAGLEAGSFEYPSQTWLADTVPSIKSALSVDPDGNVTVLPGPTFVASSWAGGFEQLVGVPPLLPRPSPLNSDGEFFKDFIEVGSGGERVSFDQAWNYWHGVDGTLGQFFFDLGNGDGTIANRTGRVAQNSDMTYADEYGAAFASIDDEVARLTASNRVRKAKGLKPAPIIEGKPSVPVLAIHTTGDLFVPIEMEQIYAQEVIDNGRGDLLVQRSMRDVGHCTFTSGEIIESYQALFEWVEQGVRPDGEDLINDIGSPSLGCEFTTDGVGSGFRGTIPACPPPPAP